LRKVVASEDGRDLVNFMVDHLPVEFPATEVRSLLARLTSQGYLDLAERLHQRIIEETPHDSRALRDYAAFLSSERKDTIAADVYFKRAVEADPNNSAVLHGYAHFLSRSGRPDDAETYYKRAIEAAPNSAGPRHGYANFLANTRNDLDAADQHYREALKSNPTSFVIRADLGQLLAGRGRLEESEEMLLPAAEHLYDLGPANSAEVCYSTWLVSSMLGRNATRWERIFKSLLEKGFTRYPWTFDRMLEQARTRLSPEDLEYARALGAAFLERDRVEALAKFERWRSLAELSPEEEAPMQFANQAGVRFVRVRPPSSTRPRRKSD
jgi:Tfp pilus assembly protein PilF